MKEKEIFIDGIGKIPGYKQSAFPAGNFPRTPA
jgi:hypothetical protein